MHSGEDIECARCLAKEPAAGMSCVCTLFEGRFRLAVHDDANAVAESIREKSHICTQIHTHRKRERLRLN